jgi:thiol-disulfide isomerase/thioredoxin
LLDRRTFLKTIGLTGLTCVLPQCQPGPLAVGMTPGEARLTDLAGKPTDLPADYAGKILVIHFWVSACSACVTEMLAFEAVRLRYPEKDVVFCSVNVGDRKATAERYLRHIRISYPVLLDEESVTRKLYRIPGVPTTYVLDRNGVVRFTTFGPLYKAELTKMVETLLNSALGQTVPLSSNLTPQLLRVR